MVNIAIMGHGFIGSGVVEVLTNNFIEAPRWYVCGENGTAIITDWDLNGKIVKSVFPRVHSAPSRHVEKVGLLLHIFL